jgi:hypothetical protein
MSSLAKLLAVFSVFSALFIQGMAIQAVVVNNCNNEGIKGT